MRGFSPLQADECTFTSQEGGFRSQSAYSHSVRVGVLFAELFLMETGQRGARAVVRIQCPIGGAVPLQETPGIDLSRLKRSAGTAQLAVAVSEIAERRRQCLLSSIKPCRVWKADSKRISYLHRARQLAM